MVVNTLNNNSAQGLDPIKVKRGRKSKKELIASLSNTNFGSLNKSQENKISLNISEISNNINSISNDITNISNIEDDNGEDSNVVIISNPDEKIDDSKCTAKKRGRKPKAPPAISINTK